MDRTGWDGTGTNPRYLEPITTDAEKIRALTAEVEGLQNKCEGCTKKVEIENAELRDEVEQLKAENATVKAETFKIGVREMRNKVLAILSHSEGVTCISPLFDDVRAAADELADRAERGEG